jgi:hypothetical protein
MAQTMIEIEPGTESWDAWLAHHRGTKTESKMVLCRHDGRPFYAWTKFPPDAPAPARADRLSARKPDDVAKPKPKLERGIVADGEVDRIAERLTRRAERDQAEQTIEAVRTKRGTREATAFEQAADAVRSGQVPKLDALDDIGMRMIDDPTELRRGRKPPPLRAKLVNLRDDPIGQMAKRVQIEQEQLDAARSWQALHDVAASVGGSRGIDPSAMKVDGGRFAEPINDVQMASIKRLEELDRVLGRVGAVLVRRILGDRMTIAQVADLMGKPCQTDRERQTERERVGWRLRECLDTLVVAMGVAVKGKRQRAPVDANGLAGLAKYANNPPLYDAVRKARS